MDSALHDECCAELNLRLTFCIDLYASYLAVLLISVTRACRVGRDHLLAHVNYQHCLMHCRGELASYLPTMMPLVQSVHRHIQRHQIVHKTMYNP